MDKYVVFRRNGVLYVTDKINYDSVVQNASKLTRLDDFKSFESVIEYLTKYTNVTAEQIINMTDKLDW